MKRAILVALGTGIVLSSAAAIGYSTASPAQGRFLERAQYEAALAGIRAARDGVEARCAALSSTSERDYCRAAAGAGERMRVADLEASFLRTPESARAAQRARIDARYEAERAKCAALPGLRRDNCFIAAHAARGRALLDAAAPYAAGHSS